MDIPLRFMAELFQQPVWVPVWVGWLGLVNMGSVFFWSRIEAKAVLVTFVASATLMMALFAGFGFERILGLGHVLWIPLLVYLALRVGRAADHRFRVYLYTLMASNAISLVLDVRDVWIYATR